MAVLLITRMDPNTRTIWEMEHVPNEPPVLDNVVKFLEKRLMAVRNLNFSVPDSSSYPAYPNDRTSSTNRVTTGHNSHGHGSSFNKVLKTRNDNRHHPYNVNQPSAKTQRFICPGCDLPHYLWFCRKFKSMALRERVENVAKWGLCPCCLIAKHPASSCAVAGCSRCDNARHNNMLCPKATVLKLSSAIVAPGRSSSGSCQPSRNNNN